MFVSSISHHERAYCLIFAGVTLLLKLSIVSTAITLNGNSLYKPVIRSPLASKLIFESPKMDNIYKEYIVSSKPLQLRKHRNHAKMKNNNKKQSRIFYITMPSVSYQQQYHRNIINTPDTKTILKREENSLNLKRQKNIEMGKVNQTNSMMTAITVVAGTPKTTIANKFHKSPSNNRQQQQQQQQQHQSLKSSESHLSENKVYQLNRHDMNGKPERIQMYHAGPKHYLTPKNFQRNVYIVKQIIH